MRTLEELAKEIRALTPDERFAIANIALDMPEADELEPGEWEAEDADTDPDITKAWEEEIERRIKSIDDGTAVGYDAELVFKELREKHGL